MNKVSEYINKLKEKEEKKIYEAEMKAKIRDDKRLKKTRRIKRRRTRIPVATF